ncbi:MAG TPA: hemolysin D [Clostridiales bacterium]|nr:MAG: hemolysin D [Clostridiales bacterium GWD2_32_59]HAN10605.1 hemolysin D [Clostridiales bacterium]
MSKRDYTYGEEIANFITHYVGAGLAVAALVLLVVQAVTKGGTLHIISFTIFGIALIFSYATSGTYHIVPKDTTAKKVMKILDHSAIYVLIAGSYTPYLLTVLNGDEAWILFAIQWILVVIGVLMEIKISGKYMYLTTGVYLAMGWMVVSVFAKLQETLNPTSLWLLIAGGIAYTIGTIFYVMKNVKYMHMIWHLFVLAGSILIFLSVYLSV